MRAAAPQPRLIRPRFLPERGRFVFDHGDGRSHARALDLAREYRQDSLRPFSVARMLRGVPFDRLFDLIELGDVRVAAGKVVPAPSGASIPTYSVTPYASNAVVKVATATTAKTLLQVATPSTRDITLFAWSVSFDGSAAATPLPVEILSFDVAATVTSLTPTNYGDPNGPASACVGGVSATGYNASAEGTPTTTFLKDADVVPPTTGIVIQYPLGREPGINISKFLRLRVTGATGNTPNAIPTFTWQE